MSEKFEVGQIIEGKVTGVKPYGAFVSVTNDIQGLVHISEVTHGYVKDIHEFLKVGDTVKVKILNIDEKSNKISLSIRATEEPPTNTVKTTPKKQSIRKENNDDNGFNSLKDKLKVWIEQSEDRKDIFKN